MPREGVDDKDESFKPDRLRGLWDSPIDFLFSSVFNVFRLDAWFIVVVVSEIFKSGIVGLFVLCASIILYAVPIAFTQSFLGQFSGTGFMAVFRITPLLKGMAYVALAMNLTSVICCGGLTAMSLVFFVHSLQPVLPWSCEGLSQWTYIKRGQSLDCQLNNTMMSSRIPTPDYSANAFFKYQTGKVFPLIGCMLLVWLGIAFILDGTPGRILRVGRILRYSGVTIVGLLSVVLIQLMYEADVWHGMGLLLSEHFWPDHLTTGDVLKVVFMAPLMISSFFGPGWGSLLTMASYNRFSTNTIKYSWLTCCIQVIVVALVSLVFKSSEILLSGSELRQFAQDTVPFFRIVSALEKLKCSRMLSWMFLLSLLIGCFNLLIVQTLSIQTALLDEFQKLRLQRRHFNFFIITLFAIVSTCVYFIGTFGFLFKLSEYNLISNGVMNLLLVLLVGWVYGKERLTRDVEFMTNRCLATWKINLLRLVTPVLLILSSFTASVVAFYGQIPASPFALLILGIAFSPWLALPILGLDRCSHATGSILKKLKICIRPSNWYPSDANDKQRYDAKFGVVDKSCQLETRSLKQQRSDVLG